MQPAKNGAAVTPGPIRRRQVRRSGPRALQACLHCKEKKLKCDDQTPACRHCERLGISCLVQDPQNGRARPRNYVEILENRVNSLESSSATTATTASSSIQPETVAIGHQRSTPRSTDYHTSPEQERDNSDLPSRFGMLDYRTGQTEPQYLGSSSAFAFSRIISLSLNRNLPTAPTDGGAEQQAFTPLPLPCPLPDYETAISLSNAYFANIHPQYPFLHEPTFRAWEAKVYEAPPGLPQTDLHLPLFFLNMVYAVAALLKSNTQTFAEQLYMSAQLHRDILANDNLESIQAILIYAIYSLRSMTGPSLWKLSGFALRQCIELGYHRSAKRHPPPANVLQHEVRKRVFWVAHGLDCSIAIRLGRPLGIPVQEIDAEFPADVDDSCITETGIIMADNTHSPGRIKSTMTNANHVFKLRLIWARIRTSLFSDTTRLSVYDTTYQTRIQQLRSDLDDWQASGLSSRKREASDLTMFNSTEWNDMNYSSTILLLYRNQLETYDPSLDRIFSECIKASRAICQGYRRLYIGTLIRYTWSTLSCIFFSGLVYLHCLWTIPCPWDTVAIDDVSKTCTDCTMVLVAIAEGWRGAAPYRDTFEVLASRTLSMLLNRDRSLPLEDCPPGAAETTEQGDWNNWLKDMLDAGTLDSFDSLFSGFIGDF